MSYDQPTGSLMGFGVGWVPLTGLGYYTGTFINLMIGSHDIISMGIQGRNKKCDPRYFCDIEHTM